MKLNIKLGVPTEALLKHPTACFRLSKALTRVSDALSFGEFYIKQAKGGVITPKDLEHMSASIWTSGRSAEDLAKLVDDADIQQAVMAYSAEAKRFNNAIRSNLPAVKAKAKAKEPKPVTVTTLTKRTTDLRKKLGEIEAKVEGLCTVDKPAVANVTPTLQGRVTMAGAGRSATPKKRPLYPRYFVASMGRSRR